jgi:hypothetical protein
MSSILEEVEFSIDHLEQSYNMKPTMLLKQPVVMNTASYYSLPLKTQTIGRKEEYMQISVKKDPEVVRWLVEDQQLESFSANVIKEVKPIFQNTSSVDAYSIELKKEELSGMDDFTMYINLSKKVSLEEMMDLWKQISVKSIEIIDKIAKNRHEVMDLLEKTTITLRRY